MQTNTLRSKLVQGYGMIFLIPCSLFALDPAKSVFQFGCQSWTRQDGLAANGVTAIAQTPDGFLWVGTQMGFVRFDGVEFKSFNVPNNPRFRNQMISALSPSKNGGLWFGLRNSAFGFFDERASFSAFPTESWVDPAMNVISLREAGDGSVWVGTGRGTARWSPGNTNETRFYEQLSGVTTIYEDSHRRMWLGTDSRGLFYWQDGKISPFPDDGLKNVTVFSMAEDPEGQIWVGTPQGLRCYDTNFQAKQIAPSYTEVKALLVDRQGVLWIGTTGETRWRCTGASRKATARRKRCSPWWVRSTSRSSTSR